MRSESPRWTTNDPSVCEPGKLSVSVVHFVMLPPASSVGFHNPPCDAPTHRMSRCSALSYTHAVCATRPASWWLCIPVDCEVPIPVLRRPLPTCSQPPVGVVGGLPPHGPLAARR